jgi:hypothetical protein
VIAIRQRAITIRIFVKVIGSFLLCVVDKRVKENGKCLRDMAVILSGTKWSRRIRTLKRDGFFDFASYDASLKMTEGQLAILVFYCCGVTIPSGEGQ